ncbi:MAG: carbohydrate ABC transporter permease [Oscillospiraceae bacterium]|nr:carbohydrate ABC transporter permease [Oscillospiraceae bacterium]
MDEKLMPIEKGKKAKPEKLKPANEGKKKNVKIKADFERTSWIKRNSIKYLRWNFFFSVIFRFFRFMLLLGGAFVILLPFFTMIAGSFMTHADVVDITVRMIPRYPTLATYSAIIAENNFFPILGMTALISFLAAFFQMAVCCLIGYGLAKFKFRGNGLIMAAVIVSLIIPHEMLRLSMQNHMGGFDLLWDLGLLGAPGILGLVGASPLNLMNTYAPLMMLSLTGLGFKNGLFIFIFRQYFKGVPDELEESAYIDGSGVLRTFFKVILPLSVPMMITVFLLSFSWQWTDEFYARLFFRQVAGQARLLPDIIARIPASIAVQTGTGGEELFHATIRNTTGLMIIIPLVIIYLFFQRKLIQGIERSGITG